MTNIFATRRGEMEANALGALRKGFPDNAAEYLTKAIGYTAHDAPTTRLDRALALCETDPRKAICTLDGCDFVGGATCYHCGGE